MRTFEGLYLIQEGGVIDSRPHCSQAKRLKVRLRIFLQAKRAHQGEAWSGI